MRKLFAVLATAVTIGIATPALAQNIDVRIGDGMHRHRSEVLVRRPRQVVVVRDHRHWDRGRHEGWERGRHEGWRHAQRGPIVIER